METRAFGIDYQSNTPEFTDALRERVRRRLEKLSKTARIRNAEIGIHTLSESQPQEYRVRIVLRTRDKNPTVIEKANLVPVALSRALEALERQVREMEEKKRSARRRAGEINRA